MARPTALHSAAPTSYRESAERLDVVPSWLLHTELLCAANRHPDDVDVSAVGVVLDTLTLVDLTRPGSRSSLRSGPRS